MVTRKTLLPVDFSSDIKKKKKVNRSGKVYSFVYLNFYWKEELGLMKKARLTTPRVKFRVGNEISVEGAKAQGGTEQARSFFIHILRDLPM